MNDQKFSPTDLFRVPSRPVRETPPCAFGEDDPNAGLSGRSLAMVYSPYQPFENLYEPMTALCRGSLFRDLDKPFLGDGRQR